MSVYKPKGSPFYHYDFWWRGDRFHGSTRRTNRREAEAVERAERDRARRRTARSQATSTSLKIDDVAGRYWIEVGQHHAGQKNTWRDLERLIDYFGATKLLTEIGDDDVACLVAWRRGHRIVRSQRKNALAPLIGNATVNRSTTEVLKKLFTRAQRLGRAFRPRAEVEIIPTGYLSRKSAFASWSATRATRLEAATRAELSALFSPSPARLVCGCASACCGGRKLDWDARQIRKAGKGGKPLVTAPITPTVRSILWPLRGPPCQVSLHGRRPAPPARGLCE